MVPARTFFCRRGLGPWTMMERHIQDMDRQFARLERDLNAAFRGLGGPAFRNKLFNEPLVFASRPFPSFEAETIPSTEAGKPGKYSIKVDVGEGFSKDNVKISLTDYLLTVDAKLEHKSEDGKSRVYQEVSKTFTLPKSINLGEIKSSLAPEGILTIEAPLPEVETPQPKEIPIPIELKK